MNLGKLFLHNDTAAIGLTSLGLAGKIENRTQDKSFSAQNSPSTSTQIHSQKLSVFANLQGQANNSLFGRNDENLFERKSVLNFNNNMLID